MVRETKKTGRTEIQKQRQGSHRCHRWPASRHSPRHCRRLPLTVFLGSCHLPLAGTVGLAPLATAVAQCRFSLTVPLTSLPSFAKLSTSSLLSLTHLSLSMIGSNARASPVSKLLRLQGSEVAHPPQMEEEATVWGRVGSRRRCRVGYEGRVGGGVMSGEEAAAWWGVHSGAAWGGKEEEVCGWGGGGGGAGWGGKEEVGGAVGDEGGRSGGSWRGGDEGGRSSGGWRIC